MRDAREHEGAVLFDLAELLRHAVEADVHLADLAGGHGFVELAGVEIAVAHAAGGERQALERAVDEARDQGSARQRENRGCGQPDQPGGARHELDARRIDPQPIGVFVDREADPQARLFVHLACHQGVFAQPGLEQFRHLFAGGIVVVRAKGVGGLARRDAHVFFIGQRFHQRHAGDRVGVDQGRPAQIHQ